jgi:hypothetical protein
MKYSKLFTFVLLFLLFLHSSNLSEGFVSGTQIKTDYGYCSIESILPGTIVCVYDRKNNTQRYCKVEEVYRSRVPKFVRLFFDNTILDVAPNQKLSIFCKNDWICADQLVYNSRLRELCEKEMGLVHAAYVNKPADVYIFTLKKYHTFYVTHANIIAHNFDLSFVSVVPFMTETIPFVASSTLTVIPACSPVIIAGACAFFGGYCLYNWIAAKQSHKEKVLHIKRKLELERQQMLAQEQMNGAFGGGPHKDPKNNKKNKNEKKPPREYTQKDYELLNDDKKFTDLSIEDRAWLIRNEENICKRKHYIRREAKENYCNRFLGEIGFDNKNQEVFRRNNIFVTYDIDGHKGGFWKMFKNNKEPRIGTYNINLEIIVGK